MQQILDREDREMPQNTSYWTRYKNTTSAVAQHLLQCEHAQHIAEQNNHNTRRNKPTFSPDSSTNIKTW